MLVSEFAKKYEESKQKSAFVSKHIKTNYINYNVKISSANRIVNISMYREINNKQVFIPNTPTRYILFVQSVIELYTDLEWDKNEDQIDVLKSIDALEKVGAVEAILASIGDDIQKYTTVLNMVVDDATDLNRSIVPFMETKLEAISVVWDTLMQAIDSPEIKNKVADFMNNKEQA